MPGAAGASHRSITSASFASCARHVGRARVSLDIGRLQEHQLGTEGLLGLAANLTRPPSAADASKSIYQRWSFWSRDAVYGVLRGEYDVAENITAYGAFGGRHYTTQYLLPFGQNLVGNGNFTENAIYNNEYYDTVSAEAGSAAGRRQVQSATASASQAPMSSRPRASLAPACRRSHPISIRRGWWRSRICQSSRASPAPATWR